MQALLPPPLQNAPQIAALANLCNRWDALPIAAELVSLIDTVDATALTPLAWQMGVLDWGVWDFLDTDTAKRSLLKEAPKLHRLLGTKWAMLRLLTLIGCPNATITERYGGQTHNNTITYGNTHVYGGVGYWATYKVTLAQPLTALRLAQVKHLLQQAAPARCWLLAVASTALVAHNNNITHNGANLYG